MQIKLISTALMWRMRTVILIGFSQAALAVFLAVSVKSLLDGVAHVTGSVWQILPVFCAAILVSILKWRERVVSEKTGQSITHEIRIALFDHLSRLSYSVFHRQRKGPLLLRFMNDLTALRQWITIGLSRLIVGISMILFSLPALWYINIYLGLIVTIIFLSAIALSLSQGPGLNRTVRNARRKRSVLASGITEKLMMVDVIQRMTARQVERRNVSNASKNLVSAMIARADRIGKLRGLTLLAGNLCIIALAAYPVMFQSSAALSTGEILAGLMLVSFMTPALFDLGRVFEYWHGARLAVEKITCVFDRGPLIQAPKRGMRKRVKSSRLRINNLRFGRIFDGLDLDVRPGQKILITGQNGSGKSTLLRLIMRLDDPDSGTIHLGRTPISHLGLGNLRRAAALVTNEDLLIKGSIEDNLKYPRQDKITDIELNQISDMQLKLNDKKSPFYRKRRIVEFGRNLSQGEKAVLLVARAILRRPEILLIDEIDVHMDRCNKIRFSDMISGFSGTVIFISHRPGHFADFDRHYELKHGRLKRQPYGSSRIISYPQKHIDLQEVC